MKKTFWIYLITVIFHGLRCFTNFSTTWLITSQKDRWVSIACVCQRSLMSIINITSIIFSTDKRDESAAGCALQAAHTTDSWICHSADGKSLINRWELFFGLFLSFFLSEVSVLCFILRESSYWSAQRCPIISDTQRDKRGWVPQITWINGWSKYRQTPAVKLQLSVLIVETWLWTKTLSLTPLMKCLGQM